MNAADNAKALIEIAAKHAKVNESATLCLDDAKECLKREQFSAVKGRVLHSLRHSVGIFHADYKSASAT